MALLMTGLLGGVQAATTTKEPSRAPEIHVQNPSEARELVRQGMQMHAAGQNDAAERSFKHALSLDPKCADAYYNLGAMAEERGDLTAALNNYHSGLKLQPQDNELKEAVSSVTEQMSHRNMPIRTVAQTGAPVVDVRDPALPPLAPAFTQVRLNQPTVTTVPLNNPPISTVTDPPRTQTPPQTSMNSATKAALRAGIGVGLGVIPGGGALHCPICRLINGL